MLEGSPVVFTTYASPTLDTSEYTKPLSPCQALFRTTPCFGHIVLSRLSRDVLKGPFGLEYTIMTSSHTAGDPHDGRWIRAKRLALGLHQHQLAAKLDINQGRVSEWEKGQKPVPPKFLDKIKTILN